MIFFNETLTFPRRQFPKTNIKVLNIIKFSNFYKILHTYIEVSSAVSIINIKIKIYKLFHELGLIR